MNCLFYKCGDDPRFLSKVLEPVTTKNCFIYGENSKSSPRIKIEYDSAIMLANYVYIEDFGRYYTYEVNTLPNGAIELICSCDYRLSYANDIRASKGRIIRSHSGNKYIPDGMATQTRETRWQFRDLGTCFNPSGGYDYIILKGGKL